jgi:hypothetical protein
VSGGGDDANPFSTVDAGVKLPAAAGATPKPSGQPAAPAGDKNRPVWKEPKEMRQHMEKISADLDSKNKAYAALEAKLADMDRLGIENKALTQRLSAMEEDINRTRGELAKSKFEASDKFKEQYDKPWMRQAKTAQRVVQELEVTDDAGNTRKATWDDFTALYSQPLNKAIPMIKSMFGDASGLVIEQLSRLKSMENDRNEALDEEKANWQKSKETEVAQSAQQRTAALTLWEQVNKDLVSSVDGYRDDPADKELTTLREEAYRVIDSQPTDMRQRILKNAHIRQRAAAFAPLKLINMRLQQQVDALKAELDGLKPKPPKGETTRAGGEPAAPAEDWNEGLRKALNSVR